MARNCEHRVRSRVVTTFFSDNAGIIVCAYYLETERKTNVNAGIIVCAYDLETERKTNVSMYVHGSG